MVFAVSKLRNFIILILFVAYFYEKAPARIFYSSLAADTIKTDKTGTISLDRKIERVVKPIIFTFKEIPKLAEPSFFHLGCQDLIVPNLTLPSIVPLGEKQPASGLMIAPVGKKMVDTLGIASIGGLIQNIILDKDTYHQGEIAFLNVTTTLPIINAKVKFLYRIYKLYPVSNNLYQTILAVPMDTDSGRYKMTLSYEEYGEKKDLKIPFTILPGAFAEKDTAELDVHILTEETLEMLKYEGKHFTRAYNVNTDSMLYDGEFILPCPGTVTGVFGTARRYNKDLDKWSHKAIDIANEVGTKVVASNNGIVVLAKDLDGHGKSVVIAHGQGIHTVYLHLNKMCVEKGDTVVKGEVVGLLGKTGVCTGPNLHWQIMVNRVPTDPRYWVKGGTEWGKGDYVKQRSLQ